MDIGQSDVFHKYALSTIATFLLQKFLLLCPICEIHILTFEVDASMSVFLSNPHARLLLSLLSLCSQVSATCYLPNGTIPNTDNLAGHPTWEYAACNNGTKYSMCCRTNLPSTDSYRETCRSDVLCTLTEDQSVWRIACTGPTWQSNDCIKVRNTGRGKDFLSRDS